MPRGDGIGCSWLESKLLNKFYCQQEAIIAGVFFEELEARGLKAPRAGSEPTALRRQLQIFLCKPLINCKKSEIGS